ncbi:MAG TPA: AlpA family transcriptional regulator [Paraburkholderia sp.]|nr:AlpA family transcriptional regulator [Paraburkholderia sp.]
MMFDQLHDHLIAKQRLIRLREVRMRVGLGRSTLYRSPADGKFPRPVQIGGCRVAWLESDIDAWIAERVRAGQRLIWSRWAPRCRQSVFWQHLPTYGAETDICRTALIWLSESCPILHNKVCLCSV